MVTKRMEFECETSLIAKTPKTRQHFFVVGRAYQIFERMTSFFLLFLGSNLGRIRSAFRAGGTHCPQRVDKQMRLGRLNFMRAIRIQRHLAPSAMCLPSSSEKPIRLSRSAKVERVVLNALAKRMRFFAA